MSDIGNLKMKLKTTTLYNIFLPLWILLFWPSALWLIILPLYYLIDRLVLHWSLKTLPERGAFCRKHTWKIWLAGFLGDMAGAAIMFAIFMGSAFVGDDATGGSWIENLAYGVGFNPFSHIGAFLLVALAVFVAGVIIYYVDRAILKKAGLDLEQAKKSALKLALITAPYLYFFPSSILYDNGVLGI